MRTRTRQQQRPEEEAFDAFLQDDLELQDISDEELELFLLEEDADEKVKKEPSAWNLPTIAGLGMIGVGILAMLQNLFGVWTGFSWTTLFNILPWFASVLIILLGFGMLSRPNRKQRKLDKLRKEARRERRRAAAYEARRGRRKKVNFEEREAGSEKTRSNTREERRARAERLRSERQGQRRSTLKRRLVKSRDKKIAGVCGGLAEYFNIDPTFVRIATVAITIFSSGWALVPYLILAITMPKPGMSRSEVKAEVERLTRRRREKKKDESGQRINIKRG